VSNFSSFCDEAEFQGRKVQFYKRAQILVSDLWACFEGKQFGSFKDIHMITMFADYRVPQALAALGVLEYSDALMNKLHKDPHLPAGERLKCEIRGCSIWGVELIRQELEKIANGQLDAGNVNSIAIDYFLWDYAKAHKEELSAVPIHKTNTIFY